MIYRTDYHIHTTFSDGKAAPEEYLRTAEAAGLSEIGFSEHIALFAENKDWCMDPDNTGNYLTYLKTLQEKSERIKIRSALEIDFYPGREKEIAEFLSRYELDYRIGSVHYLGEMSVDNGPEFYEGKNVDRLYENYFSGVIEAVTSGLFDIIAHCDLIRIFGYRPSFDPEYLYNELASKMKSCDVVYEVNTNGRNRPLGDFYPDRRYLKIFRQKGVAVCVNSDAHMPARVAQHFDEAYQLLREAGYTEMATFEGRVRKIRKFN